MLGEGAAHFGKPALRRALEQHELHAAQVGVDHAEREGEVPVALCLDEGDLVLVPADGQLAVERQVFGGKLRQALFEATLLRSQAGN